MNISNLIAVFSLFISLLAIIFSIFTYLKDRKRNNQDQLFQEKLNTYKELLSIAKTTHSKFFDIVDYVQFFSGDKNQWEKKFNKYSGTYYGLAFEFKYSLSKNSFMLKKQVLSKFEGLEFSLIHFVTSSYHQDSEITFDAYENIATQIEEIEKIIKDELNVDALTKGLEKRIK